MFSINDFKVSQTNTLLLSLLFLTNIFNKNSSLGMKNEMLKCYLLDVLVTVLLPRRDTMTKATYKRQQ